MPAQKELYDTGQSVKQIDNNSKRSRKNIKGKTDSAGHISNPGVFFGSAQNCEGQKSETNPHGVIGHGCNVVWGK